MSLSIAIIVSLSYLTVLFGAAYYTEKSTVWSKRLSDNSLVYALSLGVYCTAWTFYGSIGRAATSGLGFLGVYLGPTLLAPIWIMFLKKIIRISNYLRITSIADFASSRYGKSTMLGVLVSILNIMIVIPYISIQLKALDFSFKILVGSEAAKKIAVLPFYADPTMMLVFVFGIFSIYFGTRKLDPSEKHPGLVSVVAFESIIKLMAFIIGAIAICYYIFDGVEDIYIQVSEQFDIQTYAYLNEQTTDYQSWFWIMILSAIAFILLPRQFHMAVVENNSVRHLKKASWLSPLYLFLITLFVFPIAFAGKIMLQNTVEPDTYLLNLPMTAGMHTIALIVFIGGLAAISGMIVISMISLSIMISNNIFLPILLRMGKEDTYFSKDLNSRLLQLRRLLILAVIIASYGFYKGFSTNYSIVSVGLISFAGIAQIAPMVFLGMYWKYANRKGAIAGFVVGVLIWGYTLPFANLLELGIIQNDVLQAGPFGISALRPTALLGLEGMQSIAHGAFWSLLFNIGIFVIVSMNTKRSPEEISQSDIFINPEKYYKSDHPFIGIVKRKAKVADLKKVLFSIIGKKKTEKLLGSVLFGHQEEVDEEVIDLVETTLAGSIGSASANIVLKYLVKEQEIDRKELIQLLDQTYQTYEYSKTLEAKKNELNETTQKLQAANIQLQELDKLKNEFISNVTHELRTPITSIRSLSDILQNYEVSDAEKQKFLGIINEESERISALINQVLDLRKVEANPQIERSTFIIRELIENVVLSFEKIKDNRSIRIIGSDDQELHTDKNKLKQVLVNLISNSIKFTDPDKGNIDINVSYHQDQVTISIKDNGIGIAKENLDLVFERFYQVKEDSENKKKGSGLGLSISKSIIENLDGKMWIESEKDVGSIFYISLPLK